LLKFSSYDSIQWFYQNQWNQLKKISFPKRQYYDNKNLNDNRKIVQFVIENSRNIRINHNFIQFAILVDDIELLDEAFALYSEKICKNTKLTELCIKTACFNTSHHTIQYLSSKGVQFDIENLLINYIRLGDIDSIEWLMNNDPVIFSLFDRERTTRNISCLRELLGILYREHFP
jgi:hypothetical protein